MKDRYLETATSDSPAIAASEVMDRLTQRLKSSSKISETMKETKAAGEAIAEIADSADNPLAVVNSAKNTTGDVAQRSQTSKETIVDAIDTATADLRAKTAEAGLSLDNGYGLDEYLEKNLVVVKRLDLTDHHCEPTYSWQFDDGVTVETEHRTHYEWYNFWTKLGSSTKKKLLPEFASAEIGDPDENPRKYAELSLGPDSRPWHQDNWIECISDLVDDRVEYVETVGPRTMVWEWLCDKIGRARACKDLADAVGAMRMHARLDENGEVAEIFVPAALIERECEERSVTLSGMQQEICARGADSDELPGDQIATMAEGEKRTLRYWRLDATHQDIPKPQELPEELNTGAEALENMEWDDE